MQNKRNFFLFLIAGAFLVACHKPKHPGYEETPSGLFVKSFVKGKDTVRAHVGDRLTLQVYFHTDKDCVLIDTRKNHQPIPVIIRPSAYPGDVFDAFTMLHAGDSTGFILDTKKYFADMGKGKVKPPPFVDSTTVLYLNVKVDKLDSKQMVEDEQRKRQEEMQRMTQEAKDEEPKILEKYIADNKITVKPTKDGLYYMETQKGKGETIKTGQLVTVKYTGKFLDGQVFDSSDRAGKPFELHAGKQEVIPGWDEALLMMKKGTKATVIIPSSLAYGDGGGRMKPFATLMFDMEIMDVKNDAAPAGPMPPTASQPKGH